MSLEGVFLSGHWEGDRELFAEVQVMNATYGKCRSPALPPSPWGKWASGWGDPLTSPILGFSGVLLHDRKPQF